MNYIVSKSDARFEYRVYIDNDDNKEGRVIYKGHKLGIDENILLEVIDYRIEKSTGNLFFLKYDQINENIDFKNKNIWNTGRVDSINLNLLESWDSLIRKLKIDNGDYRKIIITKINI